MALQFALWLVGPDRRLPPALSSAMLGRDLTEEGRTLEHLGLAGRSAAEVRRVFEMGPDRVTS